MSHSTKPVHSPRPLSPLDEPSRRLPIEPPTCLRHSRTLPRSAPRTLLALGAALAHGGCEGAYQLLGGEPVHAGVGRAQAVDAARGSGSLLGTREEVGVDRESARGWLSFGHCCAEGSRHLHLLCATRTRAMRARPTTLSEHGGRVAGALAEHCSGTCHRVTASTVKEERCVLIAGRLDNARQAMAGDAEEVPSRARASDGSASCGQILGLARILPRGTQACHAGQRAGGG